jgi:hypothetical protein
VRFLRLRHFDESDTAWLTRIPVLDDCDTFDFSVYRKQFSQLLLCGRDVKISDQNVDHELSLKMILSRNLRKLLCFSEAKGGTRDSA